MDFVTFSEDIIDKKNFYVCRGYIIVLEPKTLCSLFEMAGRSNVRNNYVLHNSCY